MAKKQDTFYFDTFAACAAHAVEASQILRRCITDYDPDNLSSMLDEIHKVEHDADMKKHEMMNVLARAFITPIERDDIILLSRPEMVEAVDVVEKCCAEMELMMVDFRNFRHSKTLKDRIITINTMEEEADRIFISNMRKLHTSETSPLDIIIWRDVYRYLEQCADACEHVADVCERVLMNNT